MTIEKAIIILGLIHKLPSVYPNPTIATAVKLSIEALAFIQRGRKGEVEFDELLLPGETE